ncbi:MAG: hypothetical protein ABMA26_16145 [Limisphaerales bacterium]
MTGLSAIPQIAQIPGLQAALDAKAALASPTFSGRITQNGGTQTSGLPLLNIGGTWLSPGTIFYGIFLDVTATACAGTSELLTLAVGGLTKCFVRMDGSAYFASTINTDGNVTIAGTLAVTGSAVLGNLTIAGGTVTGPSAPLTISQTWNDASDIMLGLVVSITDSASAAASKPFDVVVGGVSVVSFKKTGGILMTQAGYAEVIGPSGSTVTLGCPNGSVFLGNTSIYGASACVGGFGIKLANTMGYFFSEDGVSYGTADAGIMRAAAGEVEASTGAAGIANRAKLLASMVKPRAGTSTSTVNAGGTLAVDTTQTGNVGAGVDTLQTYSVPANVLAANGDSIPFLYTGSFANNANTKRLILTYGATTLLDTGALTFPFTSWRIEGHVIRTGAATQKFYGKFSAGEGQGSIHLSGTAAETLSGAVTLLLVNEATDNNDAVKEFFKLDFAPAP